MRLRDSFTEWLRITLGRLAYLIAFPGIFILAWFLLADYVLRMFVMPHSWRQILAVPIAFGIVLVFGSLLNKVWFLR
jgi:hypothetical protein